MKLVPTTTLRETSEESSYQMALKKHLYSRPAWVPTRTNYIHLPGPMDESPNRSSPDARTPYTQVRCQNCTAGAQFRSILGTALGIQNSIHGIRNSILGMASHDLSSTNITILGATPGAIAGIDTSVQLSSPHLPDPRADSRPYTQIRRKTCTSGNATICQQSFP